MEDSQQIDSFSIIFNMTEEQPRLFLVVGNNNRVYSKIINVRGNFTRTFRLIGENKKLGAWARLQKDLN